MKSYASAASAPCSAKSRFLNRCGAQFLNRWGAHTVLGALVVAYIGLLIVRRPTESSTLIDGWGVDAIEIAAGILCVLAGRRRRAGRFVPILLGTAVLCWSTGDVIATFLSLGGAAVPTPSLADAFYLSFFPFAYAGMALLARSQSGRLSSPGALDGAIAGLGAAAVCAEVVFASVVPLAHRSALGNAVDLAYPIGDVLLLLVVAAGATIASGRRTEWLLLLVACSANSLGDISNLLASTSHLGVLLNSAAWPTSTVLIAAAMWIDTGHPDLLAHELPPGFVLPVLASAAALAVLMAGAFGGANHVAAALATTTLLAVLLRSVLAVKAIGAHAELRHQQSRTDHLTGLDNRRRLFEALDALFVQAQADRQQLAFLFIDLNGFKQVNDSFGHPVGDEVLRQVADRLAESLRPTDLVARIGGDEFAALLIGADAHEARTVAERISSRLGQPFSHGAVIPEMGASIGIALGDDCDDAATLLRRADAAMYGAKLARCPYSFYEEDLDRVATRFELADELSTAIDQGQLRLHYQPQFDLREDRIWAVEALVRWSHEERGMIEPLEFLPLALEAGLMGRLTQWVLSTALHQCAAWRAEGSPLMVSVNVSVGDLVDPAFPMLVADLLEREHLGPEFLTLEITETSIIEEFERAQAAVRTFSDLGVQVSVDDFGAGVTSLAYLRDLAVAEMKLDRRFIAPLSGGARSRDADVVRAMVDLGHALGLRVVAEGVEDSEALALVASLGCDVAQGFAIGHPVPVPRGLVARRAEAEPV